MLQDLVRSDRRASGGLQTYTSNMMAVMAFDVQRRYRLISRHDLEEYARLLATAVTEALHYFIGNTSTPPSSDERYLAATGAHVTHMLRDTLKDNRCGYINIPADFIRKHHLSLQDAASLPFRSWVEERVQLARACFRAGKRYLRQVEHPRCRIAGWAYMARFEVVLDLIEQDGYILRPDYGSARNFAGGLQVSRAVLQQVLGRCRKEAGSPVLSART